MNDIVQSFKFSSNLFPRAVLAIASTLYMIFTLTSPTFDTRADLLLAAAASTPEFWAQAVHLTFSQMLTVAGLFLLDGILLWWRLFDSTARLWTARLTNYFTACLWVSVTGATIFAYGRPLPDCVGEIMMTLMSLHTLTRTDYTARDRATA